MAFDYKKEYKEFYLPKRVPTVIAVPEMQFVAVRGKGDPNEPDGAYKHALNILYGMAFTIKMSKLGAHRIEGYFDYAVPPLEGFWWQDGVRGIDYARKADFRWISVIRLPDFVTKADFDWAVGEATKKKGLDFSCAELIAIDEGLCVQCMHLGAYDDEPATIDLMDDYAKANGYLSDLSETRLHHEIYLTDARRTAPEKLKTVIRHPVKTAESIVGER